MCQNVSKAHSFFGYVYIYKFNDENEQWFDCLLKANTSSAIISLQEVKRMHSSNAYSIRRIEAKVESAD